MNQKIVYNESGISVGGNSYSLEELRDFYVDQNKSQVDLSRLLGVSRSCVITLIKHFKLFKDPSVVKQNRKRGLIDRYGVDSPMKVEEFKQKSQQKIQEKYGSKSPLTNPDIRMKTKHTMLQKYGVEFSSKNPATVQKMKDNYYAKHGVFTHWQKNINHFDIWSDDDKLACYLRTLPSKPTYEDLASYFNVDRTAVNHKVLQLQLEQYVNVRPGFSIYEAEIVNFLINELGFHDDEIQRNVVGLLSGNKEVDIYLPGYKMGIEFNGDYWHSDIFNDDHGGRSTYHQEKSLLAERNGIFLFHIFEYEWRNDKMKSNILQRLKILLQRASHKLSARQCQVITLTKQQKKDFLNDYHIQGNDHSTIYLGLLYEGEIVACMTFVHPKNNKYTWELSRFCNKHDFVIRGGASKLFKHFVRTLNPGDTISSYNDITKTKGVLYQMLGFKLQSINQPNYVWINYRTRDIRTRYQEQKAGEVERMHNAGYHRICDCGTKTWLYTVGE